MQKPGILKLQKYPYHSKTEVNKINVTFFHCFFHYILQQCNQYNKVCKVECYIISYINISMPLKHNFVDQRRIYALYYFI